MTNNVNKCIMCEQDKEKGRVLNKNILIKDKPKNTIFVCDDCRNKILKILNLNDIFDCQLLLFALSYAASKNHKQIYSLPLRNGGFTLIFLPDNKGANSNDNNN